MLPENTYTEGAVARPELASVLATCTEDAKVSITAAHTLIDQVDADGNWLFTVKLANVNYSTERLAYIGNMIAKLRELRDERDSIYVTMQESYAKPLMIARKLGDPTATMGLLRIRWRLEADAVTISHKDIMEYRIPATVSPNYTDNPDAVYSANYMDDWAGAEGEWLLPKQNNSPAFFVPESGNGGRIGYTMPMAMVTGEDADG